MIETKIDGQSENILEDNINKLKELFPEIVNENKIDFDKLKQILGEELDESSERYDFTWPGKTQAIKESQKQSTGTLRPCKKESKNWDTTQNLYIEGDNLEVLKLLYKTYYGKIKMIYIDPPYNTGNDFVYSDNYTDNLEHYLEITGQTTTSEEGGGKKSIKTTTNPETSGRYHSNWLNMMYPRLKLARNLLTDDGVIFISIDDNEVGNLRKICDEIFGESNFVSCISVEMSLTQGMKVGAAKKGAVVKNGEYILIYSKNNQWTVNNLLYDKVEGYDNHFSIYLEEDSDGTLNMKSIHDLIVSSDYLKNIFNKYNLQYDFKSFRHLINISDDFREYVYKKLSNNLHQSMMAKINVPSEIQNQLNEGKVVRYDKYILYQVNSGKIRQLLPLSATIGATDDYKPIFGRRRIRGDFWKEFYKDMMNISKEGNVTFKNGKKPIRLIKQLIKWSSNTSDIVLDFFSGSATTAHAVMKLNSEDNVNRRFILVQIPESMEENSDSNKEEKELETICEIGKERIRRAGEKILEESCNKDLDVGFKVFKLDSSNLKKWDPDYNNLEQALLRSKDNIKSDRNSIDLVYEIMLKYGIDLTLPVEEHENLYSIGAGALVICLGNNITTDIVDDIMEVKCDSEFTRVVFKDNGFKSDSDKTNIKETLKIKGIDEFITI